MPNPRFVFRRWPLPLARWLDASLDTLVFWNTRRTMAGVCAMRFLQTRLVAFIGAMLAVGGWRRLISR